MFLGLWHKAQTLVSFQAENYPNTEAEEMSRALSVQWRETEKKGSEELWQLACGGPSPQPSLAAAEQGMLRQRHRGLQRGREDLPCPCHC